MKRVLSLVVLGVVALVASGARADAPREKAKFKTDDGNVVYELKKEDDGAKLVDGHEGLLARIHDKDGGLKVKGPNGEEVARLKLENGAWKIEDAAHKLQHRLESAPGQLLLKDANGAVEATIAFDATHAEAGCLAYALHHDPADARARVLIERWTSQVALDNHFQQPHMTAFGARGEELLDGAPDITVLEPVVAGDPAKGSL